MNATLVALRWLTTRLASAIVRNQIAAFLNVNEAMFVAIVAGRLEDVKFLIDMGAQICSHNGRALICAASNGHLDIVRFLVSNGEFDKDYHGIADVNPIDVAAKAGHLEVIKFLKQNGFQTGSCAIDLAAEAGHLDTVQHFLDGGLVTTDDKRRMLEGAAFAGQTHIIQYMYKIEPQLVRDNEMILYWAVSQNHKELVKYLLELGLNANVCTDIVCGLDIAKMIDNGVEPYKYGKRSAIRIAREGLYELFDYALSKDRIELSQDILDEMLHAAAQNGHVEMVQRLLSMGANPDYVDTDNDSTPLCAAAKSGHLDVVNCLLSAGVDARINSGYPLVSAAERGHLEVVQRLILAHADPTRIYLHSMQKIERKHHKVAAYLHAVRAGHIAL